MPTISVDMKPDESDKDKKVPPVNFAVESKARAESDWSVGTPAPLLDPENKEDKLPKEFALGPNDRLVIMGADPEPRVFVHDQGTTMTASEAAAYAKKKEVDLAVDRADAEEKAKEQEEEVKKAVAERKAEREKEAAKKATEGGGVNTTSPQVPKAPMTPPPPPMGGAPVSRPPAT